MRASALLLVAACGSHEMPPVAPDAPAARCDPDAPFGAPVLVGGLNSDQDDVAARLTPDELTVYFGRHDPSDNYDLYTATRASVDQPFGTPQLLTTIDSAYAELWPTLAPGGNTLVFGSDRPTPGTYRIDRSTRATPADPWGPAMPVMGLADGDRTPYLSADGARLYFASAARTGLGGDDLWVASIDGAGSASAPIPVGGLVNTSDTENAPVVTSDELRIFYRHQAGTESDVYTASRTSPQDLFAQVTPVGGLAQPGVNEVPTWISPDGCHLYLHSDAPGGPMGTNIWMVSR